MKSKRILFYSDSSVFGGHEKMTVSIANEISNLKNYRGMFLFYNSKFFNLLKKDIIKIKIPYKTHTPLPFIFNLNLIHIFKIKDLINNLNPDLVVISQGDIEYGLKGLLASKLTGIKTVSYVPFAYSFKEKNCSLASIRDMTNNSYYKVPDNFITINEYQRKLLTRFSNKKKYTLHNFVEFGKKGSYPLNNLDKKEKLEIGIIGRILFRQKNQNILVKVAKELIRKNVKFNFHIFGDGQDKNKLERMTLENNLKNYFIFYGWKNQKELEKIVTEKVAFILIPSNFEGFPLVLLEAVKMNKPFLVSNKGFIKEFEISSPFLIDNKDPEDIASKIIELSNNFNKKSYLSTKKKILHKYNKKNFKKETKKIFDDLTKDL